MATGFYLNQETTSLGGKSFTRQPSASARPAATLIALQASLHRPNSRARLPKFPESSSRRLQDGDGSLADRSSVMPHGGQEDGDLRL
jgi:hypothetical protein